MSLSINWSTKVITVPKAYMSLLASSPYEIRELDGNQLHLDLRAIEASDNGMPMDVTHAHSSTVTVGGTTLARVVEIINDYTITFEDGQYAVAVTGANTNVADVLNLNQVSVRTANSAGLVQVEGGSGDAGAVWDEILSEHTQEGTTGEALHTLRGRKLIPSP